MHATTLTAHRLLWVDQFEHATREYVTLERVLALPVGDRTPDVWGVMWWASRFTLDDLDDLATDYQHGLTQALTARNARALTRDIAGWKNAARTL